MRKKSVFALFLLLSIVQLSMAQAIVTVDAVALLNELPQPCTTVADAYLRVYPKGGDHPSTQTFYQNWTQKLEHYVKQSQVISADFYRQNPTGYHAAATQPMANKANPAQQAAMDKATSELAQKMLSDPAFAQKFAKMSEADQQAYITQQLSKNGIKPVSGTPNNSSGAPAGMDKDWMGMTTTFTQSLMDRSIMEKQAEVQQRYVQKHEAVHQWAEAEIKKLPLITFGEYGKDHDPAKVKAIQQQARNKHADLANVMLKELMPLFQQARQAFSDRIGALNTAFKQVNYGNNYNFGLFYGQVLQTQLLMLSGQHDLLTNEINVMEECAHWEWERKNL